MSFTSDRQKPNQLESPLQPSLYFFSFFQFPGSVHLPAPAHLGLSQPIRLVTPFVPNLRCAVTDAFGCCRHHATCLRQPGLSSRATSASSPNPAPSSSPPLGAVSVNTNVTPLKSTEPTPAASLPAAPLLPSPIKCTVSTPFLHRIQFRSKSHSSVLQTSPHRGH
jgi:hypothetical protein